MSYFLYLYEQLKAEWLAKHPNATQQQYEQAMRLIAEKCKV